jgi:hypothetical protein
VWVGRAIFEEGAMTISILRQGGRDFALEYFPAIEALQLQQDGHWRMRIRHESLQTLEGRFILNLSADSEHAPTSRERRTFHLGEGRITREQWLQDGDMVPRLTQPEMLPDKGVTDEQLHHAHDGQHEQAPQAEDEPGFWFRFWRRNLVHDDGDG